MKFNILRGRGVFGTEYTSTRTTVNIQKLIIYTAPDCTSSAFAYDDCTGPLSSSFNQCFISLNFHRSGSAKPLSSKREHPEIQNRCICQKSRFSKSHSNPGLFVCRNPGSSDISEIYGLQICQKSRVFKSTRNSGSLNLPETHGLQIYQKSRVFKSTRIRGLQIYQKSRVFKSTRNPGSSNLPEIQGL